jgi:hypothetical protein
MSGMPYVFEQGTVLSLLDDFLADEERAATALGRLRPQPDGSLHPVTSCGGLDAKVLQAIPDPVEEGTLTTAAAHVEQHWFGRAPDGSPGTAWWQGWRGDAESIVRWTLVSALEVALGVPHVGPEGPPATEPVRPTRFWPVHLHWCCGAPLFQGWVGWHRHGAGRREGVVTVVFTTPGVGEPMYATPHDPHQGGDHPADYESPARTVGDHGLWVVGQEQTAWVRSPTNKVLFGERRGSGVLPTAYGLELESRGDVVIVAPSEASGGVLRTGRTYEG